MRFIFFLFILISNPLFTQIPSSVRVTKAREKYEPILKKEFTEKSLKFGSDIFIRIIKDEFLLEIWVKKGEKYNFFKSYKICTYSGDLGPKYMQGDGKSPEGLYYVKSSQLNPWSNYHLAFNIGYPNAYDKSHGYTGSYLMVHGDCCSIGCYAMTDDRIEEIYTIIYNAFKNGQVFFRIHIFPFRMTDKKMQEIKSKNADDLMIEYYNEYGAFWENLKQAYDFFEINKFPPNVEVENKRYIIR